MRQWFGLVLIVMVAAGCSASRHAYSPARKYAPEVLKEDYDLFRAALEESHPSLYWYTPKDSVDMYFEQGRAKLNDSLPEYKFRNVLSYVLAQIKCGHTSVMPSRAAVRYSSRTRGFAFPLSVKAWADTVVITSNLNRRDSVVKRGMLLKSVEGRPIETIIDTFFRHISADGYNVTNKYQTLSNGGNFRSFYGNIYGLHRKMAVQVVDSAGNLIDTAINVYNPATDTPRVAPQVHHQPTKKERKRMAIQAARSMHIDTALHTAYLEVNTFAKNTKLRSFYHKSFKAIRKNGIDNVVVDMRGNGGGSVVLSNLLTKYLATRPFKIADSIYALKKRSTYGHYRSDYLATRLFMIFMTRKKADNRYHFTWFENKYFKPKKRNGFTGNTYIVIGGNTFSAASLFTKALKGQDNVKIVGEETGGGAYGNTAWLIPDVTLPHTKVRFRLPLFRLVIDKNEVKGHGIMPEVEAPPTVAAIRENRDYKMEKVQELIKDSLKRKGISASK